MSEVFGWSLVGPLYLASEQNIYLKVAIESIGRSRNKQSGYPNKLKYQQDQQWFFFGFILYFATTLLRRNNLSQDLKILLSPIRTCGLPPGNSLKVIFYTCVTMMCTLVWVCLYFSYLLFIQLFLIYWTFCTLIIIMKNANHCSWVVF